MDLPRTLPKHSRVLHCSLQLLHRLKEGRPYAWPRRGGRKQRTVIRYRDVKVRRFHANDVTQP